MQLVAIYFRGVPSGPYFTTGIVEFVGPKLLPKISIFVLPSVEEPELLVAAFPSADIVGASYKVVAVEGPELCPPICTLQNSDEP